MKVLQLVPSSATGRLDGAERVTYSLCKGLLNVGIKVVIVTGSSLKDRFLELHPTTIYVLPENEGNLLKRIRAYVKMTVYLHKILSVERPDIVHVQGSLARLLMLVCGTDQVVVETLHGVGLTKGVAFQHVVHRISDALASMLFDGSAFYMRKTINDYSKLRLLRPVRVIYNPVDEDFVKLVSRDSQSPISGEYTLWCGRLTALKGVDLLLRAFVKLGRQDVRLVLLSDGPQRNYLESLAKHLGIDNQTKFLGFVDERSKARFFQHASAICVSLVDTGLSQSLLEAVFSGSRVITGYDPEVESIFGGVVTVVRQPSVDSVAGVLTDVLRGDAKTRKGDLGDRFSTARFVQEYQNLYAVVKRRNRH